MTLPGWRALGFTWAGVLALAVGGAFSLHQLGPPSATQERDAAAQADPAPVPPSASGEAPVPDAAPRVAGEPVATRPIANGAVAEVRVAVGGATQPAHGALPVSTAMAPPPGTPAGPPEPVAPQASGAAPPRPAAPTADLPPPRPAPRAAAGLDPSLTEPGRHGPLPRISAEGRTSIRAYARPFDRSDTRPRIAIILGDFGLNAAQSDDALRRLPPAIALAITPYGYGLPAWSERARERGVETLLAIPMEPAGFPMNDPGDRALLTTLTLPDNLDRLAWALSRTQGYVGAIGAIGGMRGERFAGAGEAFAMMQDSLSGRGLLYIDPRPGARSPGRAWGRAVDVIIDEPATRGEIERRLAALEALARERGSALGLAGSPTPVVVDRIAAWAETLEAKGLVLAPVSVMIRRPDAIAPEAASRSP